MKFKKGDFVRPIRINKCRHLDKDYFKGLTKKVIRVKDVNLEYAGYQLVYVEINGEEMGFYASALENMDNKQESFFDKLLNLWN